MTRLTLRTDLDQMPTRTKYLWLLSALAATLLVVCIALYLAAPRQPVYRGKPLAYWLDWLPATLDTGNGHARMWPYPVPTGLAQRQAYIDRLNDRSVKARMAVYKSGTNGIPLLLKRLQARESRMDRLIQILKTRMKLPWPASKEDRRWQAVTAMMELGGSIDLTPIVPQLTQMSQGSDAQVKKAASFLLRNIQPKAARQPQ